MSYEKIDIDWYNKDGFKRIEVLDEGNELNRMDYHQDNNKDFNNICKEYPLIKFKLDGYGVFVKPKVIYRKQQFRAKGKDDKKSSSYSCPNYGIN
jgi:hypothetical protein